MKEVQPHNIEQYRLHIVIVTWNSEREILQCLQSIYKSPPKCYFAITVVDNASSDDTVRTIQTQYPFIRVIQNTQNIGFAAANNIVLKQRGYDYYLLLNPDTELMPNALDAIIRCANKNPDAYAIGGNILNLDGSSQRSGVTFPSNWNIFVETFFLDRLFPKTTLFGNHRKLYLDWNKPQYVDYVQGSALLIRDCALDEVGYLDESFFLFFEETDWCYRVREIGKYVLFCPSSLVKHSGGDEIAHYNSTKVIYYHESLLCFYAKHYSYHRTIIVRILLFIRCLIRISIWMSIAVFSKTLREKAISTCLGYIKACKLIVFGKRE